MKFNIMTIFPDILDSYFDKGMIRIAQEKKLIKIKNINLRDFAVDNRGTVDDRPYGGGPGQVIMVEPVYKALRALKIKGQKSKRKNTKSKIVLLSAKGKTWNQQMAKRFSKLDEITFVCPRYEGHDERIKKFVDEEIAIGDYVLTGGELGAAVIIDSVTRLLPGVLGKQESLDEESHSKPGYKEYPQYTRPETFSYKRRDAINRVSTHKLKVPKVLLSGHHKNIQEWRQKKSKS
ncbi:tRNA (guanosine(37)-N1)-methyltransferase TrmD [Candidatus Falkowbacteria bacterium]|jgi:tRNA (guanine37-N1)-methyltransferase|nr:tRNA (guanosine(37)-N1)-methyltransferase TrmD [Candidatus Falkowbacteria bacterium]MBT5502611.1 tRNA (guanosine(37)-N1)-methyltransferase TrmD [Candidatus Falkowbacteria bacterium]MBT6574450.1 tRNA (guanosine(37)-N1)-methyltransferase TrmD [Candidatus Falkowbacteria bacterium]MBT7348940.1 tRNA (guanosine(37)-N1)-methyltransferase TrmD [Candidatus Falkowbacteria bacterium]MBT7500333.1 tRNA (guanosine(37)-N1)-methyltransferase TrmD [Candidatus Falkowbacteria bacterium]